MKVLVGIPCLMTGGTEIQTLSLVEALRSAGHQVVVACYFEYAEPMVERYRKAGAEVVLMSAGGVRPSGVASTVKALWRGLKRVVREYRPDVAHVQYMAPGAIPIVILRLLGVRKIIATAHTPADIYPSLRLLKMVQRWMLVAFQCITLRAERSFFDAASIYDEATALRRRGNHFTIYNALPSYIAVAAQPRVAAPLTVGVVSRLEEIKGMDFVVPAFAKVVAKYPQARLLVVGDGSQRGLMATQAAEAGIASEVVRFVGRQEQSSLQSYYDEIDILLMPSRSEGFGLTAIEGMARGCVPVVADTGGLPEVVTDGVDGLLHRREDVDDLADKITMLFDGPEMYARLSSGALERVKDFSSARYNQLIANLYEKIK